MWCLQSGRRANVSRRILRTAPMLLLAALMTLAACAPSTGQQRAPLASAPKTASAAQAANACSPAPPASAAAAQSVTRLGPTDTARALTISLVLAGRATDANLYPGDGQR